MELTAIQAYIISGLFTLASVTGIAIEIYQRIANLFS